MLRQVGLLLICLLLIGCRERPINNPHRVVKDEKVYYGSFAQAPKTLDPARSYTVVENTFVAQTYEPPLQYNYLKRPYQLEPLVTRGMPVVTYLDRRKKPLPLNVSPSSIAYTVYDLYIRDDIKYQLHPAFARDKNGKYLYHKLRSAQFREYNRLDAFEKKATRSLTADDFVYEIKRLGSPKVQSPILSFMSHYIVGLDDYSKSLSVICKKMKVKKKFLDLRQYPLEGAKAIDKYHLQILVKGYYPQFIYWLAMPFFAPIPWEVDAFYSQPGMVKQNLTFDWYPVGTGPYILTVNNPNREMVLTRNPFFHLEHYPWSGSESIQMHEIIKRARMRLPLIDKAIYSLEKETIPLWNKFLQGYYDNSVIASDNFDQAIGFDQEGEAVLTPEMKSKGIGLRTDVYPATFFLGFNMLDPVVGGDSERARKLRLAISIVVDYEEFVSIFLNGRGTSAMSPIPPGIFGHGRGKDAINPYVYNWIDGHAVRKPIEAAKQLLAEAGYPNGRDRISGKPLLLNYDVTASSGSDDRARFAWMRKQFGKLGIELQVRPTQYNRFQDKVRTGHAQIFFWGWVADYPDPENFLFLLYGPNGKVKQGGENAVNYQNSQFDKYFRQMRVLPNGPKRKILIDKMNDILRHDSPWVFGFHPKDFQLMHDWMVMAKPNVMARNSLKYIDISPEKRSISQKRWNRPILWPIPIAIVVFLLLVAPVFFKYRRRRKLSVKQTKVLKQ